MPHTHTHTHDRDRMHSTAQKRSRRKRQWKREWEWVWVCTRGRERMMEIRPFAFDSRHCVHSKTRCSVFVRMCLMLDAICIYRSLFTACSLSTYWTEHAGRINEWPCNDHSPFLCVPFFCTRRRRRRRSRRQQSLTRKKLKEDNNSQQQNDSEKNKWNQPGESAGKSIILWRCEVFPSTAPKHIYAYLYTHRLSLRRFCALRIYYARKTDCVFFLLLSVFCFVSAVCSVHIAVRTYSCILASDKRWCRLNSRRTIIPQL